MPVPSVPTVTRFHRQAGSTEAATKTAIVQAQSVRGRPKKSNRPNNPTSARRPSNVAACSTSFGFLSHCGTMRGFQERGPDGDATGGAVGEGAVLETTLTCHAPSTPSELCDRIFRWGREAVYRASVFRPAPYRMATAT